MAIRQTKQFDEAIVLVPSAAYTADNTGTDEVKLPACSAVGFVLDATAAATESGDILAAFIQTRIGAMWVDVVAFTTVLGNGGAKRYFAKVSAGVAETMFENGAALSAGSIRNIHGDAWRARFTVTDAGTDNASFTFSITACPM